MKIEITEEDIIQGINGDACECPVALAINRMVDAKNLYASVLTRDIMLLFKDNDDIAHRYICPDDLHNFIERFDSGESVCPGTFTLIESR